MKYWDGLVQLAQEGKLLIPPKLLYIGMLGMWGSHCLIVIVYLLSWILDGGATRSELLLLLDKV